MDTLHGLFSVAAAVEEQAKKERGASCSPPFVILRNLNVPLRDERKYIAPCHLLVLPHKDKNVRLPLKAPPSSQIRCSTIITESSSIIIPLKTVTKKKEERKFLIYLGCAHLLSKQDGGEPVKCSCGGP